MLISSYLKAKLISSFLKSCHLISFFRISYTDRGSVGIHSKVSLLRMAHFSLRGAMHFLVLKQDSWLNEKQQKMSTGNVIAVFFHKGHYERCPWRWKEITSLKGKKKKKNSVRSLLNWPASL